MEVINFGTGNTGNLVQKQYLCMFNCSILKAFYMAVPTCKYRSTTEVSHVCMNTHTHTHTHTWWHSLLWFFAVPAGRFTGSGTPTSPASPPSNANHPDLHLKIPKEW